MKISNLGMIVAAGGAGKRFSVNQNKLLAEFHGQPVLLHALRHFLPNLTPGMLVVVAPENMLELMRALCDEAFPANRIIWCRGGATRIASVYNGFCAFRQQPEWIAIHDAARPLADAALLQRLLDAASECGGAIPGKTPVDTVKIIDQEGFVAANLARSALFLTGTPQVFHGESYRKALSLLPEAVRNGSEEPLELTDDAAIFVRAGFRVKAVYSNDPNPKITIQDDLKR